MDNRLNVILSPHFDDAVFSLGGLIASAAERAIVLTVFAGIPADGAAGRWDRRSGFKSGVEAMHARARENDAALAILGVPRSGIVNLDFLDRQYREDRSPGPGLRLEIGDAVRQVLRSYAGPVNLFAPGSGWHPDHRLVTESVIEPWKAHELPGADLFLYQDQPYAYLELRRRTLAPLMFAKFAVEGSQHGIAARPHWFEIDEAQAMIKLEAARRYESQFPVLRPLLLKMIDNFSRYQARAARLSSLRAELAYRLDASAHS